MCCSVNIWTGPSCFTTVAYCAQTCRMFSWHFDNLTPVGLSTTCQYCISLLEPRTYLPWLKWVCNLQLTCYWHLPASNAASHLHDLKYFSAYVHVRVIVPFSFTRPIILLKHGEHPLLIWAGRSTFMLCLLFSFLASYKTSHGLLLQCDPPPPSSLFYPHQSLSALNLLHSRDICQGVAFRQGWCRHVDESVSCVDRGNCSFRDGDKSRDQRAGVPLGGSTVALLFAVHIVVDWLQWNLSSSTDTDSHSTRGIQSCS